MEQWKKPKFILSFSMTDLLPCLGCGGEAIITREAFYEIVRCTGCGLKIDPVAACPTSWEEAKHDREQLIRKWNNLSRRWNEKGEWPFLHGISCDRCSKTHEIEDLRAYICGLESGIFDLYKKLHLR